MFPIIHSLTTTTKAVRMATKDVIKEFSDDRVVYLELRSTPRACPGMSKEEYVAAIIDGMIEGSEEFDIVTRLLLSIDRRQSVEDAEQTVKIAAADKSGLIAGVELSGDPSVDGRKFLPVLQQARDFGLKVAVHLAEVTIQLEEVHDFLVFRPDRIGHGTFLHIHEAFVNSVIQQRIPLEICLTSNVMSMTTPSIADSHVRFWMDKSVPFCFCTDDKGMMDCELSGELWKASNAFGLSVDDLRKLSIDALEISFLEKSSDEYTKLKELLESQQLSSEGS